MDETEDSVRDNVGQRLRAAREAKKLSLDSIAQVTRIPVRHIESLENSAWDALPAPAYCVGFAKNIATVVGLDRDQIGVDLREEMGGTRQVYAQAEVYEAADPKRTMPKWLIISAIAGVILVLAALTLMRNRDLTPQPAATNGVETAVPVDPAATAPVPAPLAVPAATGQVTLTALQDVWIKVRERGGGTIREAILKQGETFAIPATATAPLLDTGRPEGIRISVGGRDVPAIGPAGKSIASVSLLPADLSRGPTLPMPAATPLAPATSNVTAP